MTAYLPVVVAQGFHLPVSADRVLVADGAEWRTLAAEERTALSRPLTPAELELTILLFTLTARLRNACWALLELTSDGPNFDAISVEIGKFFSFKGLPLPDRAHVELVVQDASVPLSRTVLWGIVNLGEGSLTLETTGLRLALRPGEGCRLPRDVGVQIVGPPNEAANLLLLIHWPQA